MKKRYLLLTIIGVLSLAIPLVGMSAPNDGDNSTTATDSTTTASSNESNGPKDYTYAQAKGKGIKTLPTPAELGLPPCPSNPNWKGFASSAAAEKAAPAIEHAPECAADPTQVTYTVGAPSPEASPAPSASSGFYRYAGAETNGKQEGSRATIEVGNPLVVHGGTEEFVVARVMALTDLGNWVEAGWAEVSWKPDTRYVYTFDHPEDVWHFHTAYPLTTGNYYIWRVRDYGNDYGYGEIYWAGSWVLLESNPSMLCRKADGTHNCYQHEYLEVYAGDQTWPSVNAPVDGIGVNFNNTMLRTDPDHWVYWNDSLYSSYERSESPYTACWTSRDWVFRAPKGNC